jgi:hypothetical protein
MDLANHTPSITHLREFSRSRHAGRPTHVAQDRRQVSAPKGDQYFAFAYEKFITSVIEYVDNGCRGNAMARAAASVSPRMRPSYEAVGSGMELLLRSHSVASARRRQRNVLVGDESLAIVSLRLHLILSQPNGLEIAAHIYFSEKALTPTELGVLDTAVALAAQEAAPGAVPAIIMARAGTLRIIDTRVALSAGQIEFLRQESLSYREEWSASA